MEDNPCFTDVRKQCAAALNDSDSKLSTLIVLFSQWSTQPGGDKSTDAEALRFALNSLLHQGEATLLRVLKACSSGALESALSGLSKRDRRPIRGARECLIQALGRGCACLNDVSVSAIAAAADCSLAMKVVHVKRVFRDLSDSSDRDAIDDLWRDALADSNARHNSTDFAFVGCRARRKRAGLVLAAWVRLVSWACHVRNVTPQWLAMVDEVMQKAGSLLCSSQLLEALRLRSDSLPEIVIERAHQVWTQSLQSAVSTRSSQDQSGRENLQPYMLPNMPDWVGDDAALEVLRMSLEDMLAECAPNQLIVGMDSEWGDCGKLSIFQLAAHERVWVIDTVAPTDCLVSFLMWLFQCPRMTLVGFAFYHDAQKFARLLKLELCKSCTKTADVQTESVMRVSVADLQQLATHGSARAQLPSLKTLVQSWLARDLDKTEQCSSWDNRPLSPSQLLYAAADATALLDLWRAMKDLRTVETSAFVTEYMFSESAVDA